MKIYTSSRPYKVWQRCYDDVIPNDGCLFLKKLILAYALYPFAAIFYIPLIICMLIINNVIAKFYPEEKIDINELTFFSGGYFALNVFSAIVLFLIFCMFKLPFLLIKVGKNVNVFALLGLTGWTIVVLGLLGLWISNIIKRNKLKQKIDKHKKKYFIVEYYKILKEKYCPKVEVIYDNEK